MDDFLLRALLGGLGVALVAGPLGSFIVWRRMAYFGDTLAHSALLGVGLGTLLGLSQGLGVMAVCLVMALLLVLLQRQRRLATDTLLGILAHTTLSLGLVALAFLEAVRVDLVSYLFGDILAVTTPDLWWIWGGGLTALVLLVLIWRPLLAMTVHEELARVEGVPVLWVRLTFMMLIALVIAVAMKVVGVLLITSLMIIPAAAARRFATTPEAMAVLASVVGCVAVVLGLWGSFHWDTPTGPSVVVAAALLFAVGLLVPGWSRR
ncbi:MAG: zinc ABC transporter permease subunit ZnuB [Candidatus Competibacteraceae bacterium]|nr:zinc ABC transporter permease subunit ZnuB [Candidatus Competibacteraceae bacterium]